MDAENRVWSWYQHSVKVHYDWSELHYKFQDSFSLHIIVTILMKPNEQLKLNVI